MVRAAGERGTVGRGEQRCFELLILFGAPGGPFLGGPDHRAADKQKGEQRGEDRADLLDERQEPALISSEEHTSELQSLMRISYAVFCLTKKKQHITRNT